MSSNQSSSKNATEVLAYCSACKMDLVATVVAKVGQEIVKVQCKTCKKERAFKAPKGVKSPTEAPTEKVTKASSASGAKKAKAEPARPIQAEWQALMDAALKSSKRIKYSPRANLEVGQILEHPNFGDGVVTKILYPNKAEVLFKDDIRIMVHSR